MVSITSRSTVLLLVTMVAAWKCAESRAAIRVRYKAPAHVYSATFHVPDSHAARDNLVSSNPEAMWPTGVFLPPQTLEDPWPSPGQISSNTGSELEDYDYDPLLLTGEDAKAFVRYTYERGELFFHDIPHARSVLRNQEERRANGLAGNRLGSNRPDSPFYLWRTQRSSGYRRQ